MLLAQTKELTDVTEKAIQSAEVYGLVGYITIGLLLAFGFATWRIFAFVAPIVKEVSASTCSLHDCLKESSIMQTARLESQDKKLEKLSDIENAINRIRCPMQAQTTMTPVSPIPHGV